MESITDKNGVIHIMAKMGLAKRPISNFVTTNKEQGVVIFDEFLSMSSYTKQILDIFKMKGLGEENFLPKADSDFIRNYINTPSVQDQVLNITYLPGCGLNQYLGRLSEELNVKMFTICMGMLVKEESFQKILDGITNTEDPIMLVIDGVNKAHSDVIRNFLDFVLNTYEYNPNVRMVFTEVITDIQGLFSFTKYGEVLEQTPNYQLINLI